VVVPGGAEQVLEAPATVPEGVDLERVTPTCTDHLRHGSAAPRASGRPPSRHHGDADPDRSRWWCGARLLARVLPAPPVGAACRLRARRRGRSPALTAVAATALAGVAPPA
jgi:hypothetical protein